MCIYNVDMYSVDLKNSGTLQENFVEVQVWEENTTKEDVYT